MKVEQIRIFLGQKYKVVARKTGVSLQRRVGFERDLVQSVANM